MPAADGQPGAGRGTAGEAGCSRLAYRRLPLAMGLDPGPGP
jgi:hypothetical protein